MIAASSLVVAVLATYAGLAMLSLSASVPFSNFGNLPGVGSIVSGLGWHQPTLSSVVKVENSSAPTVGPLADTNLVNFGALNDTSGHQQTISITNHSSTGLTLQLSMQSSTGVTAKFQNGLSGITVKPGAQAMVRVANNPSYAGPISGSLQISAKGLVPLTVQIQGDQAPLPPGAVTATPAVGGAVDLSWTPSGSVSGIAGYIVKRSAGGSSSSQPIGALTTATTAVDHPPTDGTYSYQVVAVADGSAALPSTPGGVGSVTTDSTAPAQPAGFGSLPPFINQANVDQGLTVNVQLAASSQPSDTVAVTLTDSAGNSVTRTASGGGQTAQVSFGSLNQFAEGNLSLSATATDAAGNPSTAFTQQNVITKDTVAPGELASVTAPDEINTGNEDQVPVQVQTVASDDPADQLVVSLQGVSGQPVVTKTQVSAADQPILVNATDLPDGSVTVTAWVVDEAQNQSPVLESTSPTTKSTAGYPAPTFIGVAAGANNPAGVVTAASENAVIVQAIFAQAPPADDSMVIWVAGTPHSVQGDGQTSTFTIGPLDLSGLSDGPHGVGIKQTAGNGNVRKTWGAFTMDANGAEAPTSVGVPAGPNNPVGYVNAATQTAATIVAAFASPTDPADQIALSVDGVALAPESGGSSQAVWTADLSNLPDGTLQIDGTITDANGVSTSFAGSLIKDTQPPPAPVAANVVGPPPDTITPTDASCVNVTVAFNQAPDPSDMVTVTLSDENTSVQGQAPAGDGQVTVGCIDASSLSAGNIAVNVTVTDAAGNSTSVAGTSATKLPCPPQN